MGGAEAALVFAITVPLLGVFAALLYRWRRQRRAGRRTRLVEEKEEGNEQGNEEGGQAPRTESQGMEAGAANGERGAGGRRSGGSYAGGGGQIGECHDDSTTCLEMMTAEPHRLTGRQADGMAETIAERVVEVREARSLQPGAEVRRAAVRTNTFGKAPSSCSGNGRGNGRGNGGGGPSSQSSGSSSSSKRVRNGKHCVLREGGEAPPRASNESESEEEAEEAQEHNVRLKAGEVVGRRASEKPSADAIRQPAQRPQWRQSITEAMEMD